MDQEQVFVFRRQPVLCVDKLIVLADVRVVGCWSREGVAVISGQEVRVYQRYPEPYWPVEFEWVAVRENKGVGMN